MGVEFRVTNPGPRPPFGFLAEHLWGAGVDFDSDGNSVTPDDRDWTELTVIRRDASAERVDIYPLEGATLVLRVVSDSRGLAFRAASFLAHESGSSVSEFE